MRFPSVAGAIAGAGASFRRFPLALLSGLAACGVTILMIDGPDRDWMPRFLGTATMGIALFTAAGTSAERFRLDPARRWLLHAAVAAALVTIYLLSLRAAQPVALLAVERSNYQAIADAMRQNPMIRPTPPPTTVPAEKPFWRSIQSDLDGRVWVELHGPGEEFDPPPRRGQERGPPAPPLRWREPRAYDVFRRDGTYLGRLELPSRTTLSQARGDRLWSIQRGEDDEQYIIRYRISGMQ